MRAWILAIALILSGPAFAETSYDEAVKKIERFLSRPRSKPLPRQEPVIPPVETSPAPEISPETLFPTHRPETVWPETKPEPKAKTPSRARPKAPVPKAKIATRSKPATPAENDGSWLPPCGLVCGYMRGKTKKQLDASAIYWQVTSAQKSHGTACAKTSCPEVCKVIGC